MAAVLVVVFLLIAGVAAIGRGTVDRSRAHAAADAAALAGVEGGETAAARLAATNGGHLVSFAREGNDVVVTVEVEGVRARARASDDP